MAGLRFAHSTQIVVQVYSHAVPLHNATYSTQIVVQVYSHAVPLHNATVNVIPGCSNARR